MQLNDISRASLVMQAVHILRDDVLGPPHALHLSQSIVCPVGLHCCKLMPASKASGPVSGPPLLSGHELHAEARMGQERLFGRCFMSGAFPAVRFLQCFGAVSLHARNWYSDELCWDKDSSSMCFNT